MKYVILIVVCVAFIFASILFIRSLIEFIKNRKAKKSKKSDEVSSTDSEDLPNQ